MSVLSKTYLETLSSADLALLAEDFGADVPEDINRRFMIAELLELDAETRRAEAEDALSAAAPSRAAAAEARLPASYNETWVRAVHSSPVWLFVFWDISESDRWEIEDSGESAFGSLILRAAPASAPGSAVFDVPVKLTDTERHILLPPGETYIRIELLWEAPAVQPRLLAVSGSVPLIRPCPDFRAAMLGGPPPLLELSGIRDVMREHFVRHGAMFS